MKTVTKRELNQRTAQVLAAVDDGETVVVTERGVPRWRLEVFSARPLDQLRATGRVIPPKDGPADWGPRDTSRPASDVDDLLRELRDEA